MREINLPEREKMEDVISRKSSSTYDLKTRVKTGHVTIYLLTSSAP